MVAGHNLLDGVPPAAFGALAPLWTVLHVPGFLVTGPHAVFVAYPLVPWLGVTALGYVLGQPLRAGAGRRRMLLLRLGLALTIGFVLLRLVNIYGDPFPWSVQHVVAVDAAVVSQHAQIPAVAAVPADDAGAGAAAVAGVRRAEHRAGCDRRWSFGKVPLFFYVLHFYLIHLLAVAACYLRFGGVSGMFESPDLGHFPFTAPAGWAAGLPAIYLLWVAVVLALYPLCHWYAAVRRRRGDWWLSYL